MTDQHLINQTRALSAMGCSTSLPGGLTCAWDTQPGQPSSLTGAWPWHCPLPNPNPRAQQSGRAPAAAPEPGQAQTCNNPGPAAELCIISDLLDGLQDANQPQIKSSSKLMSNHILSVQLHGITRRIPGKGAGGLGGAEHSSSPSSWPFCCSQNLPKSRQGDQCGRAQPNLMAQGCSQSIPGFSWITIHSKGQLCFPWRNPVEVLELDHQRCC